jgi:4-amino-4-deoxy-L-arabinose transferase-like glycosyltransferase
MPADGAAAADRRDRLAVAGILLLALVLRLALILQMGNRYYFADTIEYEQAARSILAGHGPGPAFPRAPLYPALMALGFGLFGDGNYVGVRLVQLVVGMTVVVLTMRLGHVVGGRTIGLLSGLAAAIAPTVVFTSSLLYPTALYTSLLLAVTLLGRSLAERPGPARGAGFGAAVFLVWMTDQVALAPVGAIVGWLAWNAAGAGMRALRAVGAALSVGALVAVLLAAPWVAYHQRAYGNSAFFMEKAQLVLYFVRTDTTVAGARAVHDTTRVFRPLPTAAFVAREWRLLREQPLPYLSDYARELVHFFEPMPDRIQARNVYTRSGVRLAGALYFIPVLVLAFAGLLVGNARWRDRVLLGLVPLATAALYALFFTQTRYRIPTEPALLVLAALGLAWMAERARRPAAAGPPAAPGDAPPR